MKTITINNKEYRPVTEAKRYTCTGCDLIDEDCSSARVDSCINNNVIYKMVTDKKSKNHKISFYRYHRPLDVRNNHPKSNIGVTFFIKLNYKKRTMRISCSVCNGDNFSKERGKIQASARYDFGRYLEFSLDDYVSSQESVLDYLRLNLDDECHLPEFEAAAKQLKMRSK